MRRSSSEVSDADTNFTDSGEEKPLLLWDWDDTLFCTSHLARLRVSVAGPSEVSPALRTELAELAAAVEQTLELATRLGRVVIVTNAESGWVELTSSTFLPSVYDKYIQYLPIISARSCFESTECRSPVDWKRLAFNQLIAQAEAPVHVLSFGDSSHERDALILRAKELEVAKVKSLKLIERPDLAALKKQHVLIQQCLVQLVDHQGNLDLCIRSSSGDCLYGASPN